MEWVDECLKMTSQTSGIEWLAVLTLIGYVLLMAQENVFAWPLGIIGSGLYCWICASNQLFLDAILQVFYVVFGIYGWVIWQTKNSDLPIRTLPIKLHLFFGLFGSLLVIFLGYLADSFTSQQSTYVDGFIFVFSLIATYMTAQKILENWIYWIIIDTVALFLFYSKELYLTSGLYLLYMLLAVFGCVAWYNEYKTRT